MWRRKPSWGAGLERIGVGYTHPAACKIPAISEFIHTIGGGDDRRRALDPSSSTWERCEEATMEQLQADFSELAVKLAQQSEDSGSALNRPGLADVHGHY